MRLIVFIVLFFSSFTISFAQQNYWQQEVHYKINVTLHDSDNTLTAFEKIQYINNSPDTLYFIWFHLWPNAYKNDQTEFSKQLLRNQNTDFYYLPESERGYIDQLNFEVNDKRVSVMQDSNNIDIIKLDLPQPLLPNQSVIITTPFHEKLPYNISRGGHVGQTYQITQWYPKPAVYDRTGWHQMPYLDQGEFYSEFGSFDVKITLPENYIVAASGALQNEDELQKLKKTGKQKPSEQSNFIFWKNKSENKISSDKKHEDLMPPSSHQTKTLNYVLNNAHDFAWFASKLFLVQYDTILNKRKSINAFTFYHPWNVNEWLPAMRYLKDAVHFYSNKVGDYAYKNVSVVCGNSDVSSGGMEYPTIALITTSTGGKDLDETIAHEVGHNWFYGVIANNERDHAWMDEGINSYYENRYSVEKYNEADTNETEISKVLKDRLPEDNEKLLLQSNEGVDKDQPIETPSQDFSYQNYGLIIYVKARLWMKQLEQYLGKRAFDRAMHRYYDQWKFKHPYPEDFKRSIESSTGRSIDSLYAELYQTGFLSDEKKRKQLRFTTLFRLRHTDEYNYISILPALGLNEYDKLMLGIFIHNYQLPLNRFNFLVSPLYATGTNKLNGVARVSYNVFKKRSWLEFSLSGAKYSIDRYEKSNGVKIFAGLTRLVPSVRLVKYDKDPTSARRWNFQLRSFILKEDKFNFKTSIANDSVTAVPVHYLINQFKVTLSDNRILRPYDLNFTVDQSSHFLRTGITANYFVNYGYNEKGLKARFFAGKFFYLNTLKNANDESRYYLNMNGPTGFEDYTFSDYFFGRNATKGWESQQIMQRDGFFKIKAGDIGRSDNWLTAINVNADIPKQINPYSKWLPVQLFMDVGTYHTNITNDSSSSNVLYDAGFQISLYKGFLNIYVPLLYSKSFHDFYKTNYVSGRFWKTITFNINLQKLQLNKLFKDIPL